jgi:hypothetical protein
VSLPLTRARSRRRSPDGYVEKRRAAIFDLDHERLLAGEILEQTW